MMYENESNVDAVKVAPATSSMTASTSTSSSISTKASSSPRRSTRNVANTNVMNNNINNTANSQQQPPPPAAATKTIRLVSSDEFGVPMTLKNRTNTGVVINNKQIVGSANTSSNQSPQNEEANSAVSSSAASSFHTNNNSGKIKRVKLKTIDLQSIAPITTTTNSSENASKSSKHNALQGLDVDPMLAAELDLLYVPKNCAEQVELFAKYVWESGWKAMPHHALPNWLRDNDFLLKGHRPPLPSIKACFKSMFRIHTETGNIWTHLIGSISFLAIAIYFLSRPSVEIKLQEKFVFGAFFLGAIICLVCSTLFHTFCCFSPKVSKLFNKIDYCGISVLTMGSFVPWLYYAFYCEAIPKIIYLVLIGILGFACIVVSLWDKFSEPQFRAIRAGMFIALGLSGLIPGLHYILSVGPQKAFNVGALGWLLLMAVLYIVGACLYAARIPERLFPGRFDIWFQSHQIFHVFVVAAAFVHYHGITKLASYRLTLGDCLTAHTESDFSFEF